MPEVEQAVMNEEAYQQEEVECNILCTRNLILRLDHKEQYLVSRWKLAEDCFKTLRSNMDKFEVCGGLREHKLQGFVINIMRRLFRAWKARLHNHYSTYSTDEDRLSNRAEDIELEDWKYLVKYFGSEKFKSQLQQLVVEQQPEEIENPMNRDEILSSVLG
ncbi:hypothetical protein RDI58_017712 [Solanum bulbocastanum]|uniref:Uncharacterized protein n=1 Tax=Solanum bulbocastanum TaxID=147425 RepID=A0AAN8YC96_SOLBU